MEDLHKFHGDGVHRTHRDARGRFRKETDAELQRRIGLLGMEARRYHAIVVKDMLEKPSPWVTLFA